MARFVTGIEDVRRVFRDLPAKNLAAITVALNKSGEEIAEQARMLAPVDPATRIDLKDQIEVRLGTRTNARRGRPSSSEPNSAVVYVVAGDTPQRRAAAFAQEFGRAPGGTGVRNAAHPGHAAQPFMFPAYFSLRNRVRGRVARAVKGAAKAVAVIRRGGNA